MPWARLEDTFHRHPKIEQALDHPLGLEAIGLWVLALAWSYNTLGKAPGPEVPADRPRRLSRTDQATTDAAVAILVEVGLWERVGDHWAIHDWEQFRPPFDSREARVLGGQVRAATAVREGGRFTSSSQQAPGAAGDRGNPQVIHQAPAGTSRAGPHQQATSRGSSRHQVEPVVVGVPEGRSKGPGGVRGGNGAPEPPPYMTDPAWGPFLAAWYQRFQRPPTEGQAEVLWDAVDAYPAATATFVLDCDPGSRPSEVVGIVLDRFHHVRGDDNQAAAQAEVEWDALKRSTALPRRKADGPTPVATVLDDLPM